HSIWPAHRYNASSRNAVLDGTSRSDNAAWTVRTAINGSGTRRWRRFADLARPEVSRGACDGRTVVRGKPAVVALIYTAPAFDQPSRSDSAACTARIATSGQGPRVSRCHRR